MPRDRGVPVMRRRLPGLCLPAHIIQQRPPLLWRRLPFCVSVAAGRVALIHVSRCSMHSPLRCQSPRLAIGSANAIRAACQLRSRTMARVTLRSLIALTLPLVARMNFRMRSALLLLAVAIVASPILSGCATGAALVTGTRRAPIDPSQVRIYSSPPPKFEEVAVISANSYWSWAWNEQAKLDTATRELRNKAAKLGANGVIVKNLGSAPITAGGVGYGAFGAASINSMATIEGTAIYVLPGQ